MGNTEQLKFIYEGHKLLIEMPWQDPISTETNLRHATQDLEAGSFQNRNKICAISSKDTHQALTLSNRHGSNSNTSTQKTPTLPTRMCHSPLN
jgi:hypothetical protein